MKHVGPPYLHAAHAMCCKSDLPRRSRSSTEVNIEDCSTTYNCIMPPRNALYMRGRHHAPFAWRERSSACPSSAVPMTRHFRPTSSLVCSYALLFNLTAGPPLSVGKNQVRVAKSAKDRSFEAIRNAVGKIRNHIKINDWNGIQADFEECNKHVDKSKVRRLLFVSSCSALWPRRPPLVCWLFF